MTNESSAHSIPEAVALAVGLHQRGHLDEAEELYQRVLEIAPDDADSLHFLGVLRHQRGQSQSAVRLMRKALEIDPNYVSARINLGNALREQALFGEAESEYRQAIETDPGNADAYNNLGAVLRPQGRIREAIEAFDRATMLSPGHADAHQNLGNALKSIDRFDEALNAYRKAIEFEPRHAEARQNLGRLLTRLNRIDDAADVYAEWLELDPGNPIAIHMLAACRGDQTPPRCSDEFVRQSFDAVAVGFDDTLERLEYRAPKLAAEAVGRFVPGCNGQLNVLDAGCGTGLCGALLRPHAKFLEGVDLSSKMVAKARATGHYDELIVAEITEHLMNRPLHYDLIVSTDTLVYFGELSPVFCAAAAAIKDGGLFVFTVERIEDKASDNGFSLHSYGRYGHSEGFVTESLRDAGFEVREVLRETLRREVRQPVDGLVVTAAKRTSSG